MLKALFCETKQQYWRSRQMKNCFLIAVLSLLAPSKTEDLTNVRNFFAVCLQYGPNRCKNLRRCRYILFLQDDPLVLQFVCSILHLGYDKFHRMFADRHIS